MGGSRRARWVAAVGCVAVLGCALAAWRTTQGRRFEDAAYQRRIAAWGGRSQDLFRPSRLAPLRPWLGDLNYSLIVGSRGRLVGNDQVPEVGRDATPAELAELLEARPICVGLLAGARSLDDGWLAGLDDPAKVEALRLDGTAITDRSLDRLLAMTNLVDLGLVDTAISDASVAKLRLLPNLKRLGVGGPGIRSIRLVEPRVVDAQGDPTGRAGGLASVRGRVEAGGLPGEPGLVRVFVRTEGDGPPERTSPYGWNTAVRAKGPLGKIGPGAWSFSLAVPGMPGGKATVEVWVDWVVSPGPDSFSYKLSSIPVDLAPADPTGGPTGPSP